VRTAPLLVFLLLLISVPAATGRELRADPHTGRVRVIYAGKIVGSPFPVLSIEPSLSCTAVFACTKTQRADVIKRSLRNYFPRTYSRYLEHDVIILCDASTEAFRTDHFRWMRDGILEGGQGMCMLGGAESFTAGGWQPTEVADILPCDMMDLELSTSGGYVKVIDHDDEFMKSLPMDRIGASGFFHAANNIQPRSGAHHVAVMTRSVGTQPFLMWWDTGEGRTMAQSGPWQPAAGNIFMRWEYYGDYAINMMLFLAGRKLPDDIELVYLVRRRMRQVNDDINMLISLIEMVEKFGGSGFELNKLVVEIQAERKEAVDLYIEADLDGGLGAFGSVLASIEVAMEEAIKVRNEAAFWIFFTEWAVVSGTGMLTGVAIWILMVRRRLYREVEITRLKSI
jgi:uncharacterized membrane protein